MTTWIEEKQFSHVCFEFETAFERNADCCEISGYEKVLIACIQKKKWAAEPLYLHLILAGFTFIYKKTIIYILQISVSSRCLGHRRHSRTTKSQRELEFLIFCCRSAQKRFEDLACGEYFCFRLLTIKTVALSIGHGESNNSIFVPLVLFFGAKWNLKVLNEHRNGDYRWIYSNEMD